MELYLGTGGYSNDDWLGLLYPAGTKSGDYLKHYAASFNAVEVNSSHYTIIAEKAVAGMFKKSQSQVRFSFKLHQDMTHARKADDKLYEQFLSSATPFREAGMLAPFIAQFPNSFKRTPENRLYLKTLVDRFAGEKLALEFRDESWHNEETLESLRALDLIAVSVDYPPVRGLPEPALHITSDIAYIRMHGRNHEKWYGGKSASERHDYLYTADELRMWVVWILEQQEVLSQVYLFMMNTTKGHALKNLATLQGLFEEYDLDGGVRLTLPLF